MRACVKTGRVFIDIMRNKNLDAAEYRRQINVRNSSAALNMADSNVLRPKLDP